MKDASAVHELMLERYRLGELSEREMNAVREALDADPLLRERLAAIERSDREILEAHPPAQVAAAVEQRVGPAGRPRPSRDRMRTLVPVWALSLALIVTSGLLLRSGLRGPTTSPVTPAGDRLKGGGPSLLLFRKSVDSAIERLEPGAVAHARDVVQVAYQAAGHRYGVILSIDGRGAVTRHLPATGDEAASLQPNGPALLQVAYRLDDAPRLERFYFVASDRPFAVPLVEAAARSAASDALNADRLPLDPPLMQASFLLRKE